VGKDGESVLKKKVELSDTEMEKWARESFVERRALCVNYLPKSKQISFSFFHFFIIKSEATHSDKITVMP
jgi:hypothetical protein